MLNILKKNKKQKKLFIQTKFSPEQYGDIKFEEICSIIKPLIEYDTNRGIISDDVILSRGCPEIDQFFNKGRQNSLNIYYLSQSCSHLPKRSVRDISSIMYFLKKTFKDFENK